MPEILTKYPDVVIRILQKEGIQCSKGKKQQILTKCPEKSFCALKSGELCVFGIDQFSHMTQIKPRDLCIPKNRSTYLNSALSFSTGFLFAFLLFKKLHKKNTT